MKLIIDISEDRYNRIMRCKELELLLGKLEEAIANGTPIPDNATNEIEAIIRRYTDEQTN